MSHLSLEQAFETLNLSSWTPQPLQPSLEPLLEAGKVIFLPNLGFKLEAEELQLLCPSTVKVKRKNISYRANEDQLTGLATQAHDAVMRGLLQRHHLCCQQLVTGLLPDYQPALLQPTNTLRLHPVKQWQQGASWRKDDTRLHIDAFPSRPTSGQRILRIFTNINPQGEGRLWRVGEPFPQVAQHFLSRISGYSPIMSWIQARLKITKQRRTRYDQMMLNLHDAMKADSDYQQQAAQLRFNFPAGSSWICFSDQVPHAAMSGQYLLEQTYLLPLTAMQSEATSPYRVLDQLVKEKRT